VLLGFAWFITLPCIGQNSAGLKIYHNTDLFTVTYADSRNGTVTEQRELKYNRFSIALNLRKTNRISHELEFFMPQFSKPLERIQYPANYSFKKDEWYDSKVTSWAIRYELSKSLSATGKLGLNVGAGINPFFAHIEYFPNSQDIYYVSSKIYGAAVNIIPRLNYSFGQRVNLDFNIPFKVYDLRAEKQRIHNPAIPIRHQQALVFKNLFFERAYTIRIGITYILNKA
jgi:hypothetical protein